MTCAMCGSVGCPYCRGALPTFRTPLAHRAPLQDIRCPEQRRPIPSDAVDRAPTKCDGSDEIAGGLRVNSHVVHAPSISGEHVTDAQDFVLKPSELMPR